MLQVEPATDDFAVAAQYLYGVIGIYSLVLCHFDEFAYWDMLEAVAVFQFIIRVRIFQNYKTEHSLQPLETIPPCRN